MPNYGDSINEVGKSLGKTKREAETALQRYHPVSGKIDRVRDIFDNITPFEMFFTVNEKDTEMYIDLYFNKPPPVCSIGDTKMCCNGFKETAGSHLLQTAWPYVPGQINVLINGVPQIEGTDFTEYDPNNGWVYINGTSASPQYIDICYIRQL